MSGNRPKCKVLCGKIPEVKDKKHEVGKSDRLCHWWFRSSCQPLDFASRFQLKFHLQDEALPPTHLPSIWASQILFPAVSLFLSFFSGIPLRSPLIFPSAPVKRKCTKSPSHSDRETSPAVKQEPSSGAPRSGLEFHVVDFCSLANWDACR